MSQRREGENTYNAEEEVLAGVLAEVPDEVLPMFDQIFALRNPELQASVAEFLRIVPHNILSSIMTSKPDSKVRIMEFIDKASGKSKYVKYASYIKRGVMPTNIDDVNWAIIMGEVTNQLDHDICWAIVSRDLTRALRLIEKRDTDPNINYSVQDLIDFTNPEKRKVHQKQDHYCYTSSINRGFRYVMKNGIQREEDRPFTGCLKEIPDRVSSKLVYIKDFQTMDTIDEALLRLKHQPIGAAVAMFFPEYRNIGDKIYRGPVLQCSTLTGLHAVSLVAADVENGERYVLARSSHGESFGNKGYIKISVDVMFVYVPNPGENINAWANKYFGKPSSLLSRFSYPILYSQYEEDIQRKMHEAS